MVTALTTRELLKLAIPSILFAVLTHAYRSVDQFWIQGVSTAAQGALGASAFVIILYAAVIILLSAGATPRVPTTQKFAIFDNIHDCFRSFHSLL